MKRKTKTVEELFNASYNEKELLNSVPLCLEAYGWLNGVQQFLPSEERWIRDKQVFLISNITAMLICEKEGH